MRKNISPLFRLKYFSRRSLVDRYQWFFKQCETLEKCHFCIELQDDLTVNTGKEERFPGAFYNLISVDDTIQEMLNNYVTSAQRAEEILEAFLSIDKIELSSLEALLSFCLKIVMKKN